MTHNIMEKIKESEYLRNELKYYTKRGYDIQEIIKIFQNFIQYREKYNIKDGFNECMLCVRKKLHSIEYRKIQDKTILYISPGNAIDNTTYNVCRHFMLEIMKCLERNERFSIVFDFENYGLTKMIMDMENAYELSMILQELYYDRLECIYLIEPPFYIKPLLSMVQSMFENTIYRKIKNVDNEFLLKFNF